MLVWKATDEATSPVGRSRHAGIGVARSRSNERTAIEGSARVSLIIAGGEPAKQSGSLIILPRTHLDQEVSILITAVEVAGR
jgi:hypothetical protein